MKASKEIAKKAAEYQKLKGKVDDLYEELQEWAAERDFEDFYIHGFGVVSEPNGDNQSNGCYCDQVMLGEDYGSGTYYIPIEGSSEYLLENPADICLECEDCGEVVLDAEIYTLCARED